jgi:hypothetical protein
MIVEHTESDRGAVQDGALGLGILLGVVEVKRRPPGSQG